MSDNKTDHLGEVLARLECQKRAVEGLRTDRNRIARILREARIRVKANKSVHAGTYVA